MHGLTEEQVFLSLLAFALLLLATRAAAEVARRLGQPEVLGELLGGFIIGPSVMGALLPGIYHQLFGNAVVGQGLSLLSWIGAILLLLIAGLEADLLILRQKAVPGLLSAAGAIGSSLVVATWLTVSVLHEKPSNGFFLGLVYSVTAVSVLAKLLIERGALRRDYGQVMLAAGIASEIFVWPCIAVLQSLHGGGNAWLAGARSTALAIAFFAFMLTLGRRFTFWAMRRVADSTEIANGELSLILLLVSVAAMATAAMGLHPLLGAFAFGVLLSRAPRATVALKERIQALTVSFFAPIFFGLAGMRVNLFELHGPGSLKGIAVLLVLAGAAKIFFGWLGATAGKLPQWEAASVGLGLNLKGGSDVVVAIVGVELGLLSPDLYTLYAVVAILTVLVTPPMLARLADRALPGKAEIERLNHEEARRRAYFANMERVLVPLVGELRPELASSVVESIARAKQEQREIFDITELSPALDPTLVRGQTSDALVEASHRLARASEHEHVELRHSVLGAESLAGQGALEAILAAAQSQQMVVIGAECVDKESSRLSFQGSPAPADVASAAIAETTVEAGAGVSKAPELLPEVISNVISDALSGPSSIALSGSLINHLIQDAPCDVLLAVSSAVTLGAPPGRRINRILVPVNGLEHSLAGADVAAYLAKALNAEIVLFNVAHARLDMMFWKESEHRDLLQAGYTIVREAQFRIARLGVRQSVRVQMGADPGYTILEELEKRSYGMVVMGAVARTSDGGLALGSTTEHVMRHAKLPRLLLVSRGTDSGV
jgi:Kef-type K+ transport system membrane component KefB/nucleotide-binding universal stress UspA family protein